MAEDGRVTIQPVIEVQPKPIDLSFGSKIIPITRDTQSVKQADPDTVIFNEEAVSPELLLQLQYEDVAGMELINISRSDIIGGQNVVYTPVKNLSSLSRKYNPNNIIALPETSGSFFARFAIDLLNRGAQQPYFDDNGDLVIEVDDIRDGEIIEVEIDASGTINRVDFE